MFVSNRQDTLAAIEKMGAAVCTYTMGDAKWTETRCDCKYGISDKWPWGYGAEQTGCPTLRAVHSLLSAISDQEWDELIRRGGHAPSGQRWSDPERAELHRLTKTVTDVLAELGNTLDQTSRPLRNSVSHETETERLNRHAD